MTDEEIENLLSSLSESTCDNLEVSFEKIIDEVLHYITRLKDKNYDLYCKYQNLQSYIDNHEAIWKQNAEIERKQTANSIFRELCGAAFISKTGDEVNCVVVEPKHLLPIFKKYGVKDYGDEV